MITRRNLLLSLPALAASRIGAQSVSAIRLQSFNHVTIRVSDFKRSLKFYQTLLGMPVQGHQGATVSLRIGSGPQHIGMSAAAPGEKIGFHHFCMTADGFGVDRVLKMLADHGVTPGGPSTAALGPLKSFVRMRSEAEGGGKEGTPELYFTDADGILVQLQDASYCGGSGPLGNICLAKPEAPPRKGLLAVRDMNRPEYKRAAPELLACVETGMSLAKSELPVLPKSLDEEKTHDEQVIGQLLGLALANRCAELNVAMSLVGKTSDLRHLVRWHAYGEREGDQPRLTQGWRAEVCGDLLTDVLNGKISLRVADPQSDHPLVFERRDEAQP